MKILPTNRCFDFIAERRDPDLRLVHGVCLFPSDHPEAAERDQPFSHAWLEHAGLGECIDFGYLDGRLVAWSVKRGEYYRHFRVQVATYYTREQALILNRQSLHYGPWEQSYRALCRGGK